MQTPADYAQTRAKHPTILDDFVVTSCHQIPTNFETSYLKLWNMIVNLTDPASWGMYVCFLQVFQLELSAMLVSFKTCTSIAPMGIFIQSSWNLMNKLNNQCAKPLGPPIKNIYINITSRKTWVITQHAQTRLQPKRHWTSDPLPTSPTRTKSPRKPISNSEEDDKYPS